MYDIYIVLMASLTFTAESWLLFKETSVTLLFDYARSEATLASTVAVVDGVKITAFRALSCVRRELIYGRARAAMDVLIYILPRKAADWMQGELGTDELKGTLRAVYFRYNDEIRPGVDIRAAGYEPESFVSFFDEPNGTRFARLMATDLQAAADELDKDTIRAEFYLPGRPTSAVEIESEEWCIVNADLSELRLWFTPRFPPRTKFVNPATGKEITTAMFDELGTNGYKLVLNALYRRDAAELWRLARRIDVSLSEPGRAVTMEAVRIMYWRNQRKITAVVGTLGIVYEPLNFAKMEEMLSQN